MIAHLEGRMLSVADGIVILDVGGVGYKIYAAPETISALKSSPEERVRLWTHLSVRENALDLYGFLDRQELGFFEKLLSVSGIGPKSALGIISIAPVETLMTAVSQGDSNYLTKVSGIGAKTAQKIVLELKDKIIAPAETILPHGLKDDRDALEALTTLGYTAKEAREALQNVSGDTAGTSERIKEALKLLSTR